MLFDRIYRKNGIEHLLTKVRSPTTTGKIERWHQTSQLEAAGGARTVRRRAAGAAGLLTPGGWSTTSGGRHQALDMATAASRFQPVPTAQREVLPLWLPAELQPVARIPVVAAPRVTWPGPPPSAVQSATILAGVKVVRPRGAPP